jgi:hypothetical protein
MANTRIKPIQIFIMIISVIITCIGLMFLLTASGTKPIFAFMGNIQHMLLKYVIVILTMICGIMSFSLVSASLKNKKARNTLTVLVTIFSTVLTLPLLYCFIAFFPAVHDIYDPVGATMIKDIVMDFRACFPVVGIQYLIYVLGTIMSVVFLAEPIFSCVLTLKDKKLALSVKIDNAD